MADPVPPVPPHRQPRVLLAVAAGGALGAPARYLVALALPSPPAALPVATFLVNVSGCLALGLLVELLAARARPGTLLARYGRPFAGSGLLGAWTTYSTFAVETDRLLAAHHPATAATYAAASLLLGLLAAAAGIALGGRLAASGPARPPA